MVLIAGGRWASSSSYDVRFAFLLQHRRRRGDSISNIQDEYNRSKQNHRNREIRNLQLANDSGFTLLYGSEASSSCRQQGGASPPQGNKKDRWSWSCCRRARRDARDGQAAFGEASGFRPRGGIYAQGPYRNRARSRSCWVRSRRSRRRRCRGEGEDRNADNTRVVAQNEKNLKIVFEAEIHQEKLSRALPGRRRETPRIHSRRTHERWEATEFIQVKIGNAGGLKARINGKATISGSPARWPTRSSPGRRI